MGARNTTPYKLLLQSQRTSLLAQLTALRGGLVGRAEASLAQFGERTEDSRAQLEAERGLEFTLDARESAELEAIDAALKRIESGVYGSCVDCKTEIPAARLYAAPETTRCIVCQERQERSHCSPA